MVETYSVEIWYPDNYYLSTILHDFEEAIQAKDKLLKDYPYVRIRQWVDGTPFEEWYY